MSGLSFYQLFFFRSPCFPSSFYCFNSTTASRTKPVVKTIFLMTLFTKTNRWVIFRRKLKWHFLKEEPCMILQPYISQKPYTLGMTVRCAIVLFFLLYCQCHSSIGENVPTLHTSSHCTLILGRYIINRSYIYPQKKCPQKKNYPQKKQKLYLCFQLILEIRPNILKHILITTTTSKVFHQTHPKIFFSYYISFVLHILA